MFYKVLKDNKVIDVLDNLVYLKWQDKHKIMVLTNERDAQAILSSDRRYVWHVDGMYDVPVDKYDTVTLQKIDEYEYKQLKVLNMKSPEAIIDEFVLSLIERQVI